MTDSSGSRRYPAGKGTDSFPILESDGVAKIAFTHFRTLDPVRAAALTAAVQFCQPRDYQATATVIEAAQTFELYLTGEEAHGPTD